MTVGAVRGVRQESHRPPFRGTSMAPRKATPKVSATEAAAAATAPSTPSAKRSKTSTAAAAATQAVEEEAHNSTHGDIIGSDAPPTEASLSNIHPAGPPPLGATCVTHKAYEALQWELADLQREMLSLRQPAGGSLAIPQQAMTPAQEQTARAEEAPAVTPLPPCSEGTPSPH